MDTPVASILWFLFILALIPAGLWMLKRLPMVKSSQSSGLRVVGMMALSNSQRLVTVEVGQGNERCWLVLGVTPSSITLLHQMAPQGEPPAAAEAQGGFAETLKRLRGNPAEKV